MDQQFMESGHSKMQCPELLDDEISGRLLQDGTGTPCLPPYQQKRSPLVYVATTSLDEEPAAPKRRRVSVGMVTEDVERRVMERLARGSIYWDRLFGDLG